MSIQEFIIPKHIPLDNFQKGLNESYAYDSWLTRYAHRQRVNLGIDISEEGVPTAKKWATCENEQDEVALIVANAENLPFKNGLFDIIKIGGVTHD